MVGPTLIVVAQHVPFLVGAARLVSRLAFTDLRQHVGSGVCAFASVRACLHACGFFGRYVQGSDLPTTAHNLIALAKLACPISPHAMRGTRGMVCVRVVG